MTDERLLITSIYKSPCGELILGSLDDKLCLCDWNKERCRYKKRLVAGYGLKSIEGSSPIIEKARLQLDEYFAGLRQVFDIPLLFTGTDFQKEVWQELLRIPFGRTTSYGKLADNIGRHEAVRAVANAAAANIISIFVPCHRLIGSTGALTGYAGGIDAKRFLLNLEDLASDLFEP